MGGCPKLGGLLTVDEAAGVRTAGKLEVTGEGEDAAGDGAIAVGPMIIVWEP